MLETMTGGAIGGATFGVIGYALSAIAINRDKKVMDAIRYPSTPFDSNKETLITLGTFLPALIGAIAGYALVIVNTPH